MRRDEEPPRSSGRRALRAVGRVLGAAGLIVVVTYPVLVWLGLSRLEIRPLALLLLTLLLPSQLARLRIDRRQILRLLPTPLGIAALLVAAAVVEDRRFVLALPVLINLVLLAGFGASLRSTPMIERFARMQVDDLSDAEVRYCRKVTWLWCGFFVLNAAISLALALGGTVEQWTLWSGLLAYIAMGTLFGGELIVRKIRFRRYGSSPLDRAFARLFPSTHTETPKEKPSASVTGDHCHSG